MAHKTLISGTAYSVTGGRELIGGTGYGCKAGKTLIGGTAFTVPFSKGIPLSTITPGAILYLNESGSPVPFYIAKHDYESGLNGTGRTLVVRKDCYDERIFNKTNSAFSGGDIDIWLNGTWIKQFDTKTRAAVNETKFYCLAGGGSKEKQTLTRAVFLLSATEITPEDYNDGEHLDESVRALLSKPYLNGSLTWYWTRTPEDYYGVMIYSGYYGLGDLSCGRTAGSRPAFTLPSTYPVAQNPDGTYSPAA